MLKSFAPTFSMQKKHVRILLMPSIVCLLLTAGFIASMMYINGQGSRAAITEQEITNEQNFINQYKTEERKLKSEYGYLSEPVEANQVERVQNDILQKLKGFQLNISTIMKNKNVVSKQVNAAKGNNAVKQPAQAAATPTNEVAYELTFSGNWENTVRYIQQMTFGTGLLSIDSVSIKPKSNSPDLDTTIKYTIYLR